MLGGADVGPAGLLALLGQQPMYGAQLRAEFERRTGGTWPLNVGQVYQTLSRLERDGLVEAAGAPDEEGRIAYRLTDAGPGRGPRTGGRPRSTAAEAPRDELASSWPWPSPCPASTSARSCRRQRTADPAPLQDLHPAQAAGRRAREDLAWLLVLDNLVFAAEAEVRWLDHVRGPAGPRPRPRPAGAEPIARRPVAAAARHANRRRRDPEAGR